MPRNVVNNFRLIKSTEEPTPNIELLTNIGDYYVYNSEIINTTYVIKHKTDVGYYVFEYSGSNLNEDLEKLINSYFKK